MHRLFTTFVLAAGLPCVGSAQQPATSSVDYATAFTSQTMRLDYFHTGTRNEEHFAIDRVIADGPWPGSRTRLIDHLDLGKYRFEVCDAESGQVLYSRGFSSIHGEWETTEPAKTRWGVCHESLRFPWPRQAVRVLLSKRSADKQSWRQLWSTTVDPNSRFVNPADPPPRGQRWTILEHGIPAEKVDLVILGDGYTADEMEEFHGHARQLVDILFSEEPFRRRKADFNVWAVDTPSAASGVSRPHAGVFRRSVLGAQYSTFDSERYVLTLDNRTLRDVAAAAPYDFLVILVNERTYGGGGIYRAQTTVAAKSRFAPYLMVHEFGHHFAGLGDEYYTSDVAYETATGSRPEPWEPNLTALHDASALKWKDLVDADTPVPTPWTKEAFEVESRGIQQQRKQLRAARAPEEQLESLFRSERERMTRLLSANHYAGKVGAFEGGGYQATGLYRAAVDCVMFTRDQVGFCPVCRRAIERVIDSYSK